MQNPHIGSKKKTKQKQKNNADISRYLFLKRIIAKIKLPRILAWFQKAPLHLNDGNVFYLKFILVN